MAIAARAYIALGSNAGHRSANLAAAVSELRRRVGAVLGTSFMYETAPMYVSDQPTFLNAAALVSTPLGPAALLRVLKAVEADAGRDLAGGPRWGPRVVDLDIILYGDEVVDDDGVESGLPTMPLRVPHERYHEREFVLRPLCDLPGAAQLRDPRGGAGPAELLRALPQAARRVLPVRRGGARAAAHEAPAVWAHAACPPRVAALSTACAAAGAPAGGDARPLAGADAVEIGCACGGGAEADCVAAAAASAVRQAGGRPVVAAVRSGAAARAALGGGADAVRCLSAEGDVLAAAAEQGAAFVALAPGVSADSALQAGLPLWSIATSAPRHAPGGGSPFSELPQVPPPG